MRHCFAYDVRILATLLLCAVWTCAAGSPVAMVTDLKGSVIMAEAGKSRPTALLAYIEPGTSVKLDIGAQLVLTYLSHPLEVTLTGPAEATVGAEGANVTKGNRPSVRSLEAGHVEVARNFEPVQRKKLALATVHMRAIPRPQIIIDGPANTSIYAVAPVLAWSALPDVKSYRVIVSETGGVLHLDQSVSSNTLALDNRPLKRGASYEWRVEAKLPTGEFLAAKAEFSVLDAVRARRIESLQPAANAPFSERVLFAVQLQTENLAYDAKREWSSLAAERPDDDTLRQWAQR
jgi:hypothetical protein